MNRKHIEIPEEIRVEQLVDGVRYMLPIRQWPSRWVAWLLLLLGIVLMAVAIGIASAMPLNSFWPANGILLLIAMVFGIGGLFVCVWAQNTLIGRAEIALEGEHLRATECTGRIRRSRRRTIHGLYRILIVHEWHQTENAVLRSSELSRIAYRMVLEYESGRRSALVKWYAQEQMEPIAQDLSQRLGLPSAVVVHQPEAPGEEAIPVEQPPGSMIVVERTGEGLSAIVPPLGILRSEDGRSVTKMIGGGAAGAAGSVFAMMMFSGIGGWWLWAIFSVPAFAGVLVVTGGLLMQRDTYIDVVGDTLLISARGWRGVRQHRWTREQLKDITVGESSLEINDEHLPQLHIEPRGEETVSLLTGRRRDELRWLAHVLREALEVEDDAESESTEH